MKKAIIFPFDSSEDNYARFVLAMEMAKNTSMEVVCFSVLPWGCIEGKLDEVYLHLLDLRGYYQTCVNGWRPIQTKVRKVVRRGVFEEELQRYMAAAKKGSLLLPR